MYAKKIALLTILTLCSSLALWRRPSSAAGLVKDPLDIRPTDRVTAVVDDAQRTVLTNQRHPLAKSINEIGEVPSQQPIKHMMLVLKSDAAQEAALKELIQAQQTPGSAHYHQWLTPRTFGERFGISGNDLDQVVNWLQMAGFTVDKTPASHRTVIFSGTAGQVESAFHTSMRKFLVKGKTHYANATDPEIPQALAAVVKGVVSLNDFYSASAPVTPAYTVPNTSNGTHYLAPEDWDTIYGVTPLYGQGLDGTGQSIAVLAKTDILLTDVQTFRINNGLPANDPVTINNGTDPGVVALEQTEGTLDVEWAGAIAKKATINLVVSQDGGTDGIDQSAEYAVDNYVAPIITVSYKACETNAVGSSTPSTRDTFYSGIWTQAASEGISVFVAAGDSGSAGCDLPTAAPATHGLFVNGICSTPYTTCVGGTKFVEGGTPSNYWGPTNDSSNGSALSYIPENAWNEGVHNVSIYAGGGGVSQLYPKPTWQTGIGVPLDGWRDVPDVSMSAAAHDAYMIWLQGAQTEIGGTSAATPALASLMALVLQQQNGVWQGNINPILYTLATRQYYGGTNAPQVFNDITTGNNQVQGINPTCGANGSSACYLTGTGYDLATGLGSVNAAALVSQWSSASTPAPLVLVAPLTLTLPAAGNQTLNTTSPAQIVTLTNTGNGALTISGITITGTNANQFSVSNNPCGASLAAGANCNISVAYTPTINGAVNANLQIADNAAGNPHLVSLTGNGTALSAVTLSPASVAFGTQVVSTTSAPQIVTLTNTGSATLNITTVALTTGTQFGETSTCASTALIAGAHCTISLTFTPNGARGTKADTVTITDDAGGVGGSTQTVSLSGTETTPADTLSPTSLTFSSTQAVGTTSAPQVVTLTNTGTNSGDGTLTITSIALTGTNANQFTKTTTCGATVAPGANCTISVTYAPTAAGAVASTNLTVTDNSATSPNVVTLSGTATAPTAVLALSTGAVGFGNQTIGTTSATPALITLTNGGTAPLNISSIAITGTNLDQFAETNTCPSSLPPTTGNVCTISVTFVPTVAGSATALLTVTDNAANSPQNFGTALTGTGQAEPLALVSPASLAFGTQVSGTISSVQTVTISNTGSAPLSINASTGIVLGGANANQFQQTNTCPPSLNAGTQCAISVTFNPTSTGAKAATVTITDNSGNSGGSTSQTVNLAGTGTAPVRTVSPASLNFGTTQPVGTSAALTVTLTNTGTGTLSITSIGVRGTNANQFSSNNTCGTSLNVAASCTVSVTYAPTVAGAVSGTTLRFTDNAASSPYDVTLAGTAIAPGVTLLPANLQFSANQPVGTASAAQTVTLTNTSGAASLNITSISLTGTNPDQFAQTNTCGPILAVSSNCLIQVSFVPTVAAAASATLTVIDNAAGSPHTVSLTGTGSGQPTVRLAPSSIAFPLQATGVASKVVPVTLTNLGSVPLTITSIGLTGPNPHQFVETNNCGASLNPASSCKISVSYLPTGVFSAIASVTVKTNAASSPDTVSLTGTGIAPLVSIAPTSKGFGSVMVGTSSTPQAFVLTNSGTAALNITSIALTSTPANQFSQYNTCGNSVAAGANCTITVTYSPTVASPVFGGALVITDNAVPSPQTVTLTGAGTPAGPAITFTPSNGLAFGNQLVGTKSTASTITLTNTGSVALSITSIALGGTNPHQFLETNTCGSTLGPNNSTCTVSVQYYPTSNFAASATLKVTDNAPNSPQSVPLTGTGTAAATLAPATYSFASVPDGSTGTHNFVLTVASGATLTPANTAITGSANFTVTSNNCSGTLASLATCTIQVSWTPTTTTAEVATTLTVTDSNANKYTSALSGTGLPAAAFTGTNAFGTVTSPSTQNEVFTLTSASATTVNLTNPAGALTGSGLFSITAHTCAATLAASGTCTVTVRFAPTAGAGLVTATLSITDSNGNVYSDVLTGTGG